jgi:hypothetical protein
MLQPGMMLEIANKIQKFQIDSHITRNPLDVIDENKISSCVMERIQAGNKEYYANLHLFKSKLISRN